MVKYKPGDVIVECYPLMYCVDSSQVDTRCYFCVKASSSLRKCSKCKFARYCDSSCQARDWKMVHMAECKILAEPLSRSSIEISDFGLVLRLILLLKKHPEKAFEEVQTYNGRRSFNSLLSHSKELSEHPLKGPFLRTTWLLFFKQLGLDMETFLDIYGKVAINSFEIFGNKLDKVGSGLYVASSVFDHSCAPNVCRVFDGLKMQVRAIKSFDTETEAPVINYKEEFLTREQRQRIFENNYFFKCKCLRCITQDEQRDKDMPQLKLDFDNFFNSREPHEALEAGIKFLKLFLKHFPEPSVTQTLAYYQIASICDLFKDERLEFYETKLLENFLITHGLQHSLLKKK